MNRAQERALEAKLEKERLERLAAKQAAKKAKPSLNGLASDMEMDKQAARDGYNPNR